MAKVSNSVPKKHRHKKVLAQAKGHYSVRHRHYRRAKESVMHALAYAYAHRRERKGDFRRLWILRIGAAARSHGISYNRLMHGLREAGVSLDRKVLADLAVREPDGFAQVVAQAKAALPAGA